MLGWLVLMLVMDWFVVSYNETNNAKNEFFLSLSSLVGVVFLLALAG
jgi:hypothetical protein